MNEHKTSQSSFTFREAQLEDAQGLAEVQVLSWKAAYQGQIPSSYLDSITVAQKAEEWGEILQNSASKTILAHKAEVGVVAFVNFGDFRDQDLLKKQIAEIRALYIHPRHWRHGVGTELCALRLTAISFVAASPSIEKINSRSVM